MKIQQLYMRNFRKFEDQVFEFNPAFTVLIGDNASGKTSILDAMAIMLGTYLLKFKADTRSTGIRKDECRVKIYEKFEQITIERQEPVFLTAKGTLHGGEVEWTRNYGDRGGSAQDIIRTGERDLREIQQGSNISLPILLYYGTGRLWDRHRDVSIGKPDSRLIGYRNCLDPKSDHSLFEKWFIQLETSSLQKKKEIGVLTSVRETVKKCIPGAHNFYYDFAHGALMIELDNKEYCLFNNLSDGYRNMVAMAADIAHRAARLDPHLGKDAATKSECVGLSDEIDLHLHPKWQRQVVYDLKQAFPNIQFIASTHSPVILQSLEPGEIIDLNRVGTAHPARHAQGTAEPSPDAEYSNKSIEDILEDVMGIEMPQRSRRYQEMYDTAKKSGSAIMEMHGEN